MVTAGLELDVQSLVWLNDFSLGCHDSLQPLLCKLVDEVWGYMPTTPDAWQGSAFDELRSHLRRLHVDNMGALGGRMLMERMGVGAADGPFVARALATIQCHRREDPREDPHEGKFGGPTRHKRVFSYAEYRFMCPRFSSPMEGAVLQENGARQDHSETAVKIPLRVVSLPINARIERSACSEYLLFTEICRRLVLDFVPVVPAVRREGAVAVDTCISKLGSNAMLGVQGVVRLYNTGPSCVSCLCVCRQFQLLFPGVVLEVAFSAFQTQMPPGGILDLQSFVPQWRAVTA
eukprot:gnl/MRDRNA2_/MRDRNA2_86168_c0_seq2.p1 gnl/MRDRNA2_/MRDRNA2_86168_c0~~gnl/MRDRNA2_/MRDRNA2_86168_c0_seq2.p1  ORF type:complete len:337 (+),score=37.71 gnl/MRDRNA2_/MRDRNA2_86168_c0_seq2:139-1011(+)